VITYDFDSGYPVITLGDGDVLMGVCSLYAIQGILWFAPRVGLAADRRKWADGLTDLVPTKVEKGAEVPDTAVAQVQFLSRASLDAFIQLLTLLRDKTFPVGKDSKTDERK
jgi:hypothetical protein